MIKSNNLRVQQFLEDAQSADPNKYAILQAARAEVFTLAPDTAERFIYGGIMFSLDENFGGVFVSKNHVSFEFGHGYLFSDPDKILEGGGKFRRHLKLQNVADIEVKTVGYFVAQAIKLKA